MGNIIVNDRNGETHKLYAEEGLTFMEIIRDAGLEIEAACGGCCACGTCHIYINPMNNIFPHSRMHMILLKGIFSIYVLNKGERHDWWTNETDAKYLEKAKCIEEYYNGYYVEKINMFINGTVSIQENIADIGGVKGSYNAYGTRKRYN